MIAQEYIIETKLGAVRMWESVWGAACVPVADVSYMQFGTRRSIAIGEGVVLILALQSYRVLILVIPL